MARALLLRAFATMAVNTTHALNAGEGVIEDIVAALALALRARRAAALVLDDRGATCRAIASCGFSGVERDRLGRSLAIGDHCRRYWERLAKEGQSVYVELHSEHPAAPWDDPAITMAPHVAAPLIGSGGALIGAILIEAAAPREADLVLSTQMARVAAIASEQTRAAEAHRYERTRNAVVLDIVREVDRPVALPEVMAAICRKTVEAFGCRQATVYFHSRKYGASLPLGDHGTPPHVIARFVGSPFRKGTVPHEDEVQAGRTVVMRRDRELPPEDALLLEMTDVHTLALVPLGDNDGTVRGLLSVGFADTRELTSDELRELEIVARHAAMAIARARFVDQVAKSARFRADVTALAVEMNTVTSRTETLEILCARGCELFAVDDGALLLEAADRLVATTTHGATLAGLDGLVVALDAIDDGPVLRAFRTRVPVLENDRPRRDGAAPLDRLRSVLAIPLIDGDGVIGVLVFGALRPRVLRPHVVDEAPVLGALAAAVLRNLDLVGRLHETNQQLGRLSAVKDQFLANVSHDLRTPLNIIIGFAQLALENTFGEPPAELREILDRMLVSAHQQLTLVEDLLDVSRLELNGLTVKPVPVPLAPLFAEMEFLVTSLVRHKPVRIGIESPAADVWVHADPNRLRQILTNLLTNAVKFTDEGTIALRALAGPDRVRIDVVDSGVGIPADHLESIFEPFRQVEGDRAALGTGLGLAIAQRLAHLMRGSLTVTSALGRGSTFSVELSTARAPDPAQQPSLAGERGIALS